MIYPFKGYFPLTQSFGVNPQNYSKFGLQGHNGLDFGLPTSTQILAAISGNVIESLLDPTGYGNYIKIENDTEGCLVAHLERSLVGPGEHVQEGMVIGYSDNTGNSTGPHLHFGYYIKPRNKANGYSGYIDPTPYFKESGTITDDMPTYLKTLLQENHLDLTNESEVREFFQKALSYDSLKLDKENCDKEVTILKEQLKDSTSSSTPSNTSDLSAVSVQDLMIALIKKIFKK